MIIAKMKSLFRQFRCFEKDPINQFLKDIRGVVHVGANFGQEKKLYKKYDLNVIWVEPIPEVFDVLKENIKDFTNQQCFEALVTDVDDKEYQFHISNNNGKSSSIFDFKYHKDIWPNVSFSNTISIKSITLISLFQKEKINITDYNALILDTQGSELLVLRGSIKILDHFKYIKTEVADFESYEGCCQLDDIYVFMKEHGYKEYLRHKIVSRPGVGNYYDIVYKKID